MNEVVRLLLIEDSADDAELILRTLEREGHKVAHRRVDSEATLVQALAASWDLVVSDFSMPGFDGLRAHEIVKAADPLVPFVFVSGVLGEERAVEAMRSGARDYVLKDNLARLPPVVNRVLADLDNQRRRLAAERALEFQQRRYQSIFETAPVALLEVDLSGARSFLDSLGERGSRLQLAGDEELLRRVVERVRVLSANPAALDLVGVATVGEMVGPGRMRPGTASTWLEIVDALRRGGTGLFSRELIIRRRDGGHREVLLSFRLPPAAAELRNVVVSVVDVSERNSMERQMRAAQRMEGVGRLAGGVAHDFNNVLTVIRGYAELIGLRLGADHAVQQDLAHITEAAESAELLTRQLLAFSRRERSEPQVLNINERLRQIQTMLARLLGEDITLQFMPADDLWPVKIDPSHVEQVLMNLAINARDAMPAGGRLIVETANRSIDEPPTGDYVMLVVTDTGYGMDAAIREQIFEPFFTTKEAARGTGLGLSTVHRIVTEAGGRIQVYSELEHGATFRILFPRADVQEADLTRLPASRGQLGGSESVLVVEDEALVRGTAERMLDQAGYRVYVAADGNEALALLAQHDDIAAMVTDVIMPGMNGRDLADRVRERRPGMPVLFVSGYPSHALTHRDLLADDVDYLEKPYTATDLLGRLRDILERQ